MLAEDPLACPLEQLPVITVEQTVVDGRRVYDRAHDAYVDGVGRLLCAQPGIEAALVFAMAGDEAGLARAFDAYARRDDRVVLEHLLPLLPKHERLGSSRSQRQPRDEPDRLAPA